MKKSLKPGTSMAPVPVVMVSCEEKGKRNITTVAWTGVVNSEPPLIYISLRKNRYSYEMIKNTGEFVINIPDEKLVWETDYCGTKSGADVDKFEKTGMHPLISEKIATHGIEECPINIECKVVEIKELGSHQMIIGEVVAVKADEEYVKESGAIDYATANLLTYAGTDYLSQNKVAGRRGISQKEK